MNKLRSLAGVFKGTMHLFVLGRSIWITSKNCGVQIVVGNIHLLFTYVWFKTFKKMYISLHFSIKTCHFFLHIHLLHFRCLFFFSQRVVCFTVYPTTELLFEFLSYWDVGWTVFSVITHNFFPLFFSKWIVSGKEFKLWVTIIQLS